MNISILPRSDNTYDLGSESYRWRKAYLTELWAIADNIDNGLRIRAGLDSGKYGFATTYGHTIALVNEQGTVNQAIVLGDTEPTAGDKTLFGVSVTTEGSNPTTGDETWTKLLDLRGNGDLWLQGSIFPLSDNSSDLGSSSYRWRNGYFAGNLSITSGQTTGYLYFDCSNDAFIWHEETGNAWMFLECKAPSGYTATVGIFRTAQDGTPRFRVMKGDGTTNIGVEIRPREELIQFGGDVTLYRSATDVLKTDDNFDALALRIGGTEVISSSREIYNITALALQDNELRLRSLTDGYHRIGYDSSRAGLSDVDFWKFNASLLFEGGTAPNYVMHLDGNNSRVGINKLNPSQTLDVNGNFGISGVEVLTSGRVLKNIASVAQTLLPSSDDTYDLGSSSYGWRYGYIHTLYPDRLEIRPKYVYAGRFDNFLGLSAIVSSNAFGFNPPYKVEMSTDGGSTWTDITGSYDWKRVTNLKGDEVAISLTANVDTMLRFYFNVGGWAYGDLCAIGLLMRWVNALKYVKVESSDYSDFSANVSTHLEWSGSIGHWDEKTIWQLDSRTYGRNYIRITITIMRTTDGTSKIRQIIGFSYANTEGVMERWMPFDWTSDKEIIFQNLVRPSTDNSYDLGSSSYGWRDLHIKRDVYLYDLPEVTPTE